MTSSFARRLLGLVIRVIPARRRVGIMTACHDAVVEASDDAICDELRRICLSRAFQGVQGGEDPVETWLVRKAAFTRYIQRFTVVDSSELAWTYGMLRLLEETRGVPGDIVECGVGLGKSLTILLYGVAFLTLDRTVYGFDSFAGFPRASEADLGPRVRSVGVPSGWTRTSVELIRRIVRTDQEREGSALRRHPVRVELVPGFFADTLPKHVPEKIALLHVDCDLYESTKQALDYCLPRMSPGGVVILDEYHEARWPGATAAVDEVCTRHGLNLERFPLVGRFGLRV